MDTSPAVTVITWGVNPVPDDPASQQVQLQRSGEKYKDSIKKKKEKSTLKRIYKIHQMHITVTSL